MHRARCSLAIAFFALLMTFMTTGWAADCRKTGESCIDGPSTKTFYGVPITRACWNYQSTYECASQFTINDCQYLRDKGCTQVSTQCIDRSASGRCDVSEQTYQCQASAEVSTQKQCVIKEHFVRVMAQAALIRILQQIEILRMRLS